MEEFYDLLLICHTKVHELRVARNLDAVFLDKVCRVYFWVVGEVVCIDAWEFAIAAPPRTASMRAAHSANDDANHLKVCGVGGDRAAADRFGKALQLDLLALYERAAARLLRQRPIDIGNEHLILRLYVLMWFKATRA